MHVSDLHICHPELRSSITRLAEVATGEIGVPVSIGIATEASLETLRRAVEKVDPDVICVTGDVTTFGDRASFSVASTYISEIKRRSGGTGDRPVVITPGNHDVLCSQFRRILGIRSFWSSILRRTKLRKTTRLIKDLLGNRLTGAQEDPLANYRAFLDTSGATGSAIELGNVAGKPVWCVPFDSVTTDSLWVNAGRTSPEAFRKFYDELRKRGERDSILIALVHHNPVSSPNVDEHPLLYAYNSMPGSSLLVHQMQLSGTDLILFGHQHQSISCVMDFLLDTRSHVHLLGAPSATCDEPGVNVVEIRDRYYADYYTLPFSKTGGFRLPLDGEYRAMVFDTDRPYDMLTVCTKSEIRHFRYLDEAGEEDQWNQMHRPGVKELRIIGPRLNKLMVEARREEISRILEHPSNEKIRILLGDPDLFSRVRELKEEDRAYLSAMWGDDSTWENQANNAARVLDRILDFRNKLSPGIKEKLEVRVAHTLLPIGAVARDIDDPDGTMLIRLLPVGRMGEIKRPILRLTRRHPEAVYRFYLDYIKGLWDKARVPEGINS
jgi:3',5'-cyclic AMP phosphodiesterase CpdA